jgi:hypothetical protein
MSTTHRKTFPKILPQLHPDAKLARFTQPSVNQADPSDSVIAAEISRILVVGKVLFGKGDGEWKYLDEKKRSAYIGNIRRQQDNLFPDLFANMFRTDATYGIATPSYADVDSSITDQILLDLDACYEFTRLRGVAPLLFDRSWGNPYGLVFEGKVLSPDSPRHYYFAEKLVALNDSSHKQKIVEIGGGYGGLAFMFNKMCPDIPYIIVDLFETCILQYYFLRKAGIKVSLVLDPTEMLEPNTVAIVPTDISDALLARYTDIGVIFNSRSFSEMSETTVKHYFSLIQNRLRPQYILHENSNFLLFPNSIRHLEILASEFPVDPVQYHLLQMNISPFLGGGGRYREFLYERAKDALNNSPPIGVVVG